MPISIGSGRTSDDAYRAPKVLSLDDHVEEDLWKLMGRLRRDLSQLRRLGPAPACADATFSPDEISALVRDIEYLVTDGSEVATVLTTPLKQGLRHLLAYLQAAEKANAFVHAHVE